MTEPDSSEHCHTGQTWVQQPQKVQDEHQEKVFLQAGSAIWEDVAQGGCGVAVIGYFQNFARQSHVWAKLVFMTALLGGGSCPPQASFS